MSLIQLIRDLSKQNIAVKAVKGELKLVGDVDKLTPDLLQTIRNHKAELLEFVHKADPSVKTVIPRIENQPCYPLSGAQKRIWLLAQHEGGLEAYNISTGFHIKGEVQPEALNVAIHRVINRHEILRTVFKEQDGEAVQVVLPEMPLTIDLTSGFNGDDLGGYLEQKVHQLSHAHFDLENGPLLKLELISLSSNEHVLLLGIHHIISDGWSIEVLLQELFSEYGAITSTTSNADFPDLNIHYKDYLAWQSEKWKGEATANEARVFWADQALQTIEPLQLPTNFPRPGDLTFRGGISTFDFRSELTDQINIYCKQQGVTLFNFLRASVSLLLHKFSQQDNLVVGVPVAARTNSELTSQIGLYVNSLPLSSCIEQNWTFEYYLHKLSRQTAKAMVYQDYPFDQIIVDLDVHSKRTRNPLFDVMMVLQNEETDKKAAVICANLGWEIQSLTSFMHASGIRNYTDRHSKFDLTFNFVHDLAGCLLLEIEYNADLFKNSRIQQFFESLEVVIAQVLENPYCQLGNIEWITVTDKKLILENFNGSIENIEEFSLWGLLHPSLQQNALKPALLLRGQTFSYNDLHQKANGIASCLQMVPSLKGNIVGLLMGRSENMVATILAAFQANITYLPIELSYPRARIEYMLKDAEPPVLLVDALGESQVPPSYQGRIIRVEDIPLSDQSAEIKIDLRESIAYLIYTSGSTGKPKGVEICHRNVIAFLKWAKQEFAETPYETIYAATSYCFDLSIFELIFPLLQGKTIRILDTALEIPDFLKYDQKVLLNTVPSVVANLLTTGIDWSNIVALNMAGEAVPFIFKQQIDFERMEVRNLYGPSEDTTYSTCYRFKNDEWQFIPIGVPVDYTNAYVLDKTLQFIPIGIDGEIYLSGQSVAKGYLNQPELTNERFVPNPFVREVPMYKTGDLGAWLPTGELAFSGRIDHQVKLRGYRIELGEVEQALLQQDQIKQAVVVVEEMAEDKLLVAYVVANGAFDEESCNNAMKGVLAPYMLPSHYVNLKALPLNSNGKLDRNALPGVSGIALRLKDYQAPKEGIESNIADIWKEVLGLDEVGVTNDFFELGGHSLKATQLINKLNKQLGIDLKVRDFFKDPSILGILKCIEQSHFVPIRKAKHSDLYPITSSQKRFWVLSQFEDRGVAYHIPITLSMDGQLNINILSKAFDILVERHESLRTTFIEQASGMVCQKVLPTEEFPFKLKYHDLRNDQDSLNVAHKLIQSLYSEAFDLGKDALLRAWLIQVKDGHFLLAVCLHHIIGDGWSLEVMRRELISIYNDLKNSSSLNMPQPALQFKDFAVWMEEELEKKWLKDQEDYWLSQLAGELPLLELPVSKLRPSVKTYSGAVYVQQYSKSFLTTIEKYAQEKGATLFMTLMAGLNGLFYRYTRSEDIILGTPIAGRHHPDLENQIGLYLNTLAIRTQFSGENSFGHLLTLQKKTLIEAYDNQLYPFERLIEQLNLQRDTGRSALFDIMVVLQNQRTTNISKHLEFDQLKSELYTDIERKTSQLDMMFSFLENEKGLLLQLEYNTDLFSLHDIEQITSHFEQFLQNAIAQPEQSIETIDYISIDEKNMLLNEFNKTTVDHGPETTLVSLFQKQVGKTPNAVAIVFEDRTYTYLEVDTISNQLANYLLSKCHLECEDLIGVKLERSEWLVFALLAVLKTEAAYVPLDINYPEDRITYIEQDSQCKMTIDNAFIEAFNLDRENHSIHTPDVRPSPTSLAYVIYTSGSTGKPKGVMIEHRNAAEMIAWATNEFESSSFDMVYATTSHCFDLSVYEIFYSLSIGKTIRILKNALEIEQFLESDRNVLINTVPSVIKILVDKGFDFKNVAVLNMAGEPIPVSIVPDLIHKGMEIRNLYGPSEDTTYSSCYRLSQPDYLNIPIGRPLSNTYFYVLDQAGKVAPLGSTGELFISGKGLSRGYLNKADLTKDKFVPNPFLKGERMYSTGDLVRWLPNMQMEFIGRKDSQVKLRGYRIELGEIESVINQQRDLLKQAVIAIKNIGDEPVIVAYLVAKGKFDQALIKSRLLKDLPDYMLPGFFVEMDKLPLTPNGKIDRNALPEVGEENRVQKDYEEPRNELERSLVAIWEELLGIRPIGVHSSFFELGGHSLLAIKLVNKMNSHFGLSIPLSMFFKAHTVSETAMIIRQLDVNFQEVRSFEDNDILI